MLEFWQPLTSSSRKLSPRLKSNKIVAISLTVIFCLGLGLRLWHLGDLPAGVTVDEANFGYIAYSLLQTGKDEHAHPWPISFTAFGEEKLPFGAYILLPSVYFLGLGVFSTRLPSAIFGSLSIILIYFFARQFRLRRTSGLLLSLFWAVSPITFFLSRFAYESNLALTLFLLGLIGMVCLKQQNDLSHSAKIQWPAVLLWSVSWAFTWYSYIAYRPIMLFFLLGFGICWFYLQPKLRLSLVSVFAIFSLLILPSFIFSPAKNVNLLRFQQVGILSDAGIPLTVNENRTFCTQHTAFPTLCYLFWNKPILIAQELLSRFCHVFSFDYLFLTGENDPYTNVPGYGQFNLIFSVFLFAGVYSLISRESRKTFNLKNVKLIIIVGLLIGALPAITVGVPPKFRLSPLIPFLFLLASFGLDNLLSYFSSLRFNTQKKVFLTLSIIFASGYFVFTTSQFFMNFFTIYPFKYDFNFNSYVKELSMFLSQNNPQSQPVYLRVDYPDPLMFYSFFTAYPPAQYQKKVTLGPIDSLGFQHAIALDNMQVTDLPLPVLLSEDPSLTNGYYVCHSLDNFLPVTYQGSTDLEDLPLFYIAYSENGALKYAYIVDIAVYLQQFPSE